MGNFCQNHKKYINEPQDNELLCIIIGQELIKAIKQRVQAKRSEFSKNIDQQNIQNKRIITKYQSQMGLEVNKIKQMIEKYYLGGLNGFKQAYNKSIEELIGLQGFAKQLLTLEAKWKKRLLKCHQEISNQLAFFEEKQISSIHKIFTLKNTQQNSDKLRKDSIWNMKQNNRIFLQSQISAFLAVFCIRLKNKYSFPRFFIQNKQQLDIFFQKMQENFSQSTKRLIGGIEDHELILF